MTTVAIICGYDLDSDIDDYIDRVSVKLAPETVDAVILSGGRTSPHTDASEASTMAVSLKARLHHDVVLLDHEAMTTLDNIVYAKRLALQMYPHVDRYIVFGDVAHIVKIWLLSRIILRRPPR